MILTDEVLVLKQSPVLLPFIYHEHKVKYTSIDHIHVPKKKNFTQEEIFDKWNSTFRRNGHIPLMKSEDHDVKLILKNRVFIHIPQVVGNDKFGLFLTELNRRIHRAKGEEVSL